MAYNVKSAHTFAAALTCPSDLRTLLHTTRDPMDSIPSGLLWNDFSRLAVNALA